MYVLFICCVYIILLCPVQCSWLNRLLANEKTQSNNNTINVYANPVLFGETAAVGDEFNVFNNFDNYTASNTIVNVVRVPSGEIVERCVHYREYNYTLQPDVAISFDSQQALLFNNSVFTPITLINNQSLPKQLQQLVNTSLNDIYTIPYQYNIISMIYNSDRIPYTNETFNVTNVLHSNGISNYTLESAYNGMGISIINYTLVNPLIDDTGLGFLLWVISEYGDPAYNITGIQSSIGDWRYWYLRAFKQNVTVFDTWSNAFDAFLDPTTNVTFMSSYGLDPAYNVCQNITNNIVPLNTNVNNTVYAWGELVEMGVLNTTTNFELSEQFINYIFNDQQAQNQTIYQDWSMPANANVTLPSCYFNSGSILPNETTLYNTALLSQVNLHSMLPIWLDQWAHMYNGTYNGTYHIGNISYQYNGTLA